MAITLKQQREQDQRIIQEAISDADLDKLNVTYTQIDQVLNGLSDEGRQALSPISTAIEQAQKNIQQVAGTPGTAIPDALVSKTISQLVLLQSIMVQVFQQLPKIMNVVKRGMSKHLSRSPYEGQKESITLQGKYLTENYERMTLQEVVLMLEKADLLEQDEGVINLVTLYKRLYQQAQESGLAGDMDAKTFRDEVIKPAMTEFDIPIGSARDKLTEPQVNVLMDKVFKTERPGTPRRTSRGTTEEEEVGPDSPIWAHLRGTEGADKAAIDLIKTAMEPKGFFNKLKSALKGEGLPFGLNADAFAKGILALPFKDFTKLVDNSGAIKIQMDPDKAKEVTQTTQAGGKETTGRGNRIRVSKIGNAMEKHGIKGGQKDTILKFFNTLVGRGPIEFAK